MANVDKEVKGQMTEQLYNLLQTNKMERPVISYSALSIDGTKGGISIWQGLCFFEKKLYHG